MVLELRYFTGYETTNAKVRSLQQANNSVG